MRIHIAKDAGDKSSFRRAEVTLDIDFAHELPEVALHALDLAVTEARATLDAIFEQTSKES